MHEKWETDGIWKVKGQKNCISFGNEIESTHASYTMFSEMPHKKKQSGKSRRNKSRYSQSCHTIQDIPTHLASSLTSAQVERETLLICKICTLLRITAQSPACFIASSPDKWKILSLSKALSVYLKPIFLGSFFFDYTHSLFFFFLPLKSIEVPSKAAQHWGSCSPSFLYAASGEVETYKKPTDDLREATLYGAAAMFSPCLKSPDFFIIPHKNK